MGAQLLAFSHIEKAAGTTLIHVLRRAFPLSYIDARPMSKGHGNVLSNDDLGTLLSCNPMAKAIGGHSIYPYTSLAVPDRELRYMTLLREPVSRTVSHFRFWRHRMGHQHSAEEFLEHPVSKNFQVRKIAGTDDINKAKDIICSRFLLAGSVESFDEFLLLFSRLAGLPRESLVYSRENTADRSSHVDAPADFESRIAAQNELDIALYEWVTHELRASYIASFGSDFESQLANFQKQVRTSGVPLVREWLSNFYRGLWLKPVSGVIRVRNGLTYSGVYAAER